MTICCATATGRLLLYVRQKRLHVFAPTACRGLTNQANKKACGNILVWICHTPVGEYLLTVLCLCLVSAVAKEAQQIQEEVDKVEIQVQRA